MQEDQHSESPVLRQRERRSLVDLHCDGHTKSSPVSCRDFCPAGDPNGALPGNFILPLPKLGEETAEFRTLLIYVISAPGER